MLPSESSLPIARRATWRDTECLELVCGIANAGGGRLILDADVDSRGAVKRRTSRLMKTIPGLIAQSLNLTCAVELVLDSGRFCLEVVIPPANDPISFRGIFFFYKDGETTSLTMRHSIGSCSAIWRPTSSGSSVPWCRPAWTT